MANILYPKAKESFLKGEINLLSDTLKIVLVDTDDYTINTTTDQFLSDIPVIARIAISAPMTSKSVVNGVFDAADVDFINVVGDEYEAVVMFQDTGNPSTSRLIFFFDTGSGIPIQPNGGNQKIEWNNGPSKIFAL